MKSRYQYESQTLYFGKKFEGLSAAITGAATRAGISPSEYICRVVADRLKWVKEPPNLDGTTDRGTAETPAAQ